MSKGEILSLAIQFGWGVQKKQRLQEILAKLPAIDIKRAAILEQYAEIDSYSQGKNPTRRLPSGVSARNMGKNDVWIAATASVLGAKLVTIDKDFDHLKGVFVDVEYIDQSLTAADA